MNNMLQDIYVQKNHSMWLHDVVSQYLNDGTLKKMLQQGVRGVILSDRAYKKAFADTTAYDRNISYYYKPGMNVSELYENLMYEDVRLVADCLAPIYHVSHGFDGFVSFPLNPHYAYNTQALVQDGLRLFKKIRRPNIIFEIPATKQGCDVFEQLTSSGINVHMTCIVSLEQYQRVHEAYMRGIRSWLEQGALAWTMCSVVSVPYNWLEQEWFPFAANKYEALRKIYEKYKNILGYALCISLYEQFEKNIADEGYKDLMRKDVHLQRLMWGHTYSGAQGVACIQDLKVLMFDNSINTVDVAKLDLFFDEETITNDDIALDKTMLDKFKAELSRAGIDYAELCEEAVSQAIIYKQRLYDEVIETLTKVKK